MVFDNSKIQKDRAWFLGDNSFSQGAREIMVWLDANPSWKTVDETLNATIDSIISSMSRSSFNQERKTGGSLCLFHCGQWDGFVDHFFHYG